jgi:plastocyanin
MKSIILIVVALLVLGGGGYYYMTNMTASQSTPDVEMEKMDAAMEEMDHEMEEEEMTADANYTVTDAPSVAEFVYTKDGYSPKTVTIKAGETISFINKSEIETQPSFGEHMNHAAYPDKKVHPSLKMGESDKITFPEAGTFEFHNHHNEDHKGTVVVE